MPRESRDSAETVYSSLLRELLSTSEDRLVEGPFQGLVDAATPLDDSLGPFEIIAPALHRPSGRRILRHLSDVTDLVGQLDQFGPG